MGETHDNIMSESILPRQEAKRSKCRWIILKGMKEYHKGIFVAWIH